MKRGEAGCFVLDRGQGYEVAPPRVTVIDTTGAGDSFDAGYIAALVRGMEPRAAAQYACACGARQVTAFGATAGIREAADVDGLLPEGFARPKRRRG